MPPATPSRRVVVLLAALVPASGLAACGSGGDAAPTAPAQPPAALSSQGGRLVGGGPAAFRAQLARLRGTPVVVNQWASWCGPCRFEFPFFARAAEKLRGRVAFLGVNSQDARPAAQDFLRQFPVPYPSFFDPTTAVAREFRGGLSWPTTAFYNSRGRLTFTHQGAYATQAKLEQDIREHALAG